MSSLSHLDDDGRARMIDVGAKPVTRRVARAAGRLTTTAEVIALVRADGLPKADVLATARIAGIAGAKRTSELIPLAHILPLDSVTIDFGFERRRRSSSTPRSSVTGPHRRRDGGAHRRRDRRAHAARHGQGGRSACRARRHPAAREVGRQARRVDARRGGAASGIAVGTSTLDRRGSCRGGARLVDRRRRGHPRRHDRSADRRVAAGARLRRAATRSSPPTPTSPPR